jgi:hypothetical protein
MCAVLLKRAAFSLGEHHELLQMLAQSGVSSVTLQLRSLQFPFLFLVLFSRPLPIPFLFLAPFYLMQR